MLLKSRSFWIASLVFLAATLGIIWFGYPPALLKLKNLRDKQAQLNQDLAREEQFANTVSSLEAAKSQLLAKYDQANLALPKTVEPDILLLQLDGLLAAIGQDQAKLTVPFTQTKAAVTAVPAQTSDVKAGSVGATNVTSPTTAEASSNFTINGNQDFSGLETLLTRLKNFGRWNRVTEIDITFSGDKYATTVISSVFAKAESPTSFTNDSNQLLLDAEKLFSPLQSYSKPPDVTTEGTFGRANPFAAP